MFQQTSTSKLNFKLIHKAELSNHSNNEEGTGGDLLCLLLRSKWGPVIILNSSWLHLISQQISWGPKEHHGLIFSNVPCTFSHGRLTEEKRGFEKCHTTKILTSRRWCSLAGRVGRCHLLEGRQASSKGTIPLCNENAR